MRRGINIVLGLLLVAGCSTPPPPGPPSPVPPPSPPPVQPPQPVPVPVQTPAVASPIEIEKPIIRVGLSSDVAAVVFRRVKGGYVLGTPTGRRVMARGFTLEAPEGSGPARFAIQIGAMTDRRSADALAARAGRETGLPTKLHFDTASTTYKVLVGDFVDETTAQQTRTKVVERGYPSDIFIVRRPSDRAFEAKITLTDDEGERWAFKGESIVVALPDGSPITISGKTYRGSCRVLINARGSFNVVNELNIDDYVRGVVPNEMGPYVFDSLEALKAQAIAARTYAIKRMGEYRAEGYDICGTPSCQVYKGHSTEHPLSNRAVDETSLLIMTYNGEPIDSLYTSTCGGETSDVGVMFPGRSEPYLRRVRCIELDMKYLDGRANGRSLDMAGFRADVVETLVSQKTGDLSNNWSAREVAAAVEAAGEIAGLKSRSPGARPDSSRRRDVFRYLADAWALGAAARTLLRPEDVDYMFGTGSSRDEAAWVAALLIKFEVANGDDLTSFDAAMTRRELYGLLYGWLEQKGVLQEQSGTVRTIIDRRLTLREKGKDIRVALPAGIAVYHGVNDRYTEARLVPIQVGDRGLVVRLGRRAVAFAAIANHDGGGFDQRSAWSSWVRSYSEDELVKSISQRNPISKLEGIQIKGRDSSGRVTGLEVKADGRTFTLEGLPIRWSLGVPDNLFVFETGRKRDGTLRYTFLGKGWGHGIGMCQNGAFGMGIRGFAAEEILKHYYTGIEIEKYH